MKKIYLIEGVSGSGKTTVCEELSKLGYKTIDGDEELADFVDPKTGLPTDDHSYRNWRWNEERFNNALEKAGDGIIFICGGAMNKPDFLHHFTKVFTLHLDDETLKHRLATRTSNDYGKKPEELAYQLKMNQVAVQHSKENGTILIDASQPLPVVIDTILGEVAGKNTWKDFYEITKDRPPSELLVRAVKLVSQKDKALDLGAGALKDTKYLLESGFNSITVVDKEPAVGVAVEELSSDKVTFIESSYEDFPFLEDKYDIINAQYALPFNNPMSFNEMFLKLTKSLKAGGIFTGQFFGVNDEWNGQKSEMTFHTLEEVQHLLSDMEILEMKEEDKDSRLANGTPKHWHLFNIIARK